MIYLCPGSHHLRLSAHENLASIRATHASGYRPCADVTLKTASEFARASTIGVVLTGMGHDGAAGVEAVKAAGGGRSRKMKRPR